MSGNTVTKATLQQRIRGLIAGTQKHAPNGSLTFGSATYATPALVQLLKSLADALDAADSAKASWQDVLKGANDARAKVGPIVRDYQAWVAVTYRGTPSMLADYGVTRKVRTPLTAEQKAAAALKRKATREARHTMGSKQKKSVKGTVPTTAPVAPSTATQPVAPSPVASAPSPGTGGVAAPRVP